MNCLGVLTIGSTSAVTTAGVYEFGRSNPNSQTIVLWQGSNVFTELGAGIYKWQVRRKLDQQLVKVGYSTVEQKNNCTETVLNLDYGIYLHPIQVADNQRNLQMPTLDSKYKFVSLVVNNIEYEDGAEYERLNGQIVWNSPFALEATDKVRIKYLFFSQTN